jgi:fumarylacetoacetate (FAA) hydrolase
VKLASIKNGTRDGRLVVVSSDLRRAAYADCECVTLREALENWHHVEVHLRRQYNVLNTSDVSEAFAFDAGSAAAPLPRANQWLDGSAFLNHSELFVTAYKLERNTQQVGIPLMYQGACDDFLGPQDDIPLPDEADDIDFEGEIAVILDDVPMGTTATSALAHVKLVTIMNDVSLRAHGAREMKTGFGFVQGKPSSSFAPIAVTPDELGPAWHDGRLHLPLLVTWNDHPFGHPHGREMSFTFADLIAHASRTRRLSAATVIGSGTVSNKDRAVGSATIAERRVIELLEHGEMRTGFMQFGDRVRIEMLDTEGRTIFGAIDQKVVRAA